MIKEDTPKTSSMDKDWEKILSPRQLKIRNIALQDRKLFYNEHKDDKLKVINELRKNENK